MKSLKDIYNSHQEDLAKLYEELTQKGLYDSISFPLLLSDFSDETHPKIMIFGQETNGWDWLNVPERPNNEEEGGVEYLTKLYEYFDLGEGKQRYNTLFWQYFRQLREMFGITSRHEILWNNINKFGKASGSGRPIADVTRLENKLFNVLREELDVIKPDVCIFLTGPNYDNDLVHKLPDAEFLEIGDYQKREFALVKSKYLPSNSFRTYHPGYGNRYYDWYQQIMKRIVEFCM